MPVMLRLLRAEKCTGPRSERVPSPTFAHPGDSNVDGEHCLLGRPALAREVRFVESSIHVQGDLHCLQSCSWTDI